MHHHLKEIKIGIIGMPGRMCLQLVEVLAHHPHQCTLASALAKPRHALIGQDSGQIAHRRDNQVAIAAFHSDAFHQADVWIEFARPEVSLLSAEACVHARKPLIIATTGHDEETKARLRAMASSIPLLLAPNTSLGVATLKAAVRLAAQALGAHYASEIVEIHHDRKRDAPSGTALFLADAIAQERGLDKSAIKTARQGSDALRQPEEIGIAALRGGNVVGEHTVYFFGAYDRLELTHRAHDRRLFAEGALFAARVLASRSPGYYTLDDIVLAEHSGNHSSTGQDAS